MAYTKLTYGDEIIIPIIEIIVDSDDDIDDDFLEKYENAAQGSMIQVINNGNMHY